MVKEELINKSPIRILEKSIHGGLKAGNIGVIASRKGVGKTAVLVQIAIDKLMQGKHVIHVSFKAHSEHVVAWYEDLFAEVAAKRKLEDMKAVHDELVKNRVLMNFNQEGIVVDQLIRSLRSMIVDGGFKADAIIVDGYDFAKGKPADLAAAKAFASELGLEFWYSCTLPQEGATASKDNVPSNLHGFMDSVSVLIVLDAKSDGIEFKVVKDHDRLNPVELTLKLDSKTLLIAEKK
jgi:KaiC/GvpD/RAD55 family RecA-like ATPase